MMWKGEAELALKFPMCGDKDHMLVAASGSYLPGNLIPSVTSYSLRSYQETLLIRLTISHQPSRTQPSTWLLQ